MGPYAGRMNKSAKPSLANRPASYEIASVLPPSEHFTVGRAGAIALFVHETTAGSAYQSHVTVYGTEDIKARRLSDAKFQGVIPRLPLLWGRNNGYTRALIDQLRKRQIGIIEVHNRVQNFFQLAKAFSNTPISLYFHNDPQTIKGAMTPKERWKIAERADAIYCCSDYVRRRFLTGLEAARSDHVHVVYHGVPPLTPKPRKDPLILFVGRLIPEKGALELAQAAQKLLPYFPNWQIAFVGSNRPGGKGTTPYTHAVGKALQALGKQAVFLGHQPHQKVLELYCRASIAVVPSIWNEPMGRTALEAMAAGCALVTSGHGGLGELVGEAGVLSSPVTADGLALALQGLLEDPATLRDIQQQCLARGSLFSLANSQRHMDQLRYHLLAQAYGG